jgi:prolipoprotein diacylglyceryltransferase
MAAGSLAGLAVLRRRGGVSAVTVAATALAWLGVLLGSKIQFRLEALSLPEAFSLSWWDLVAGGRRLPLGLCTGLLLAGLWCWLAAAPWRAVGDALAVAYSVFIPIGRLGCLSFGCCMGTACALWGGRWCPRFPPGSEAYNQQLRDGLISLDATASLPAHPLPVYFAVASLLTLGVLLWELRRRAPAGTLLAAFCVLRPAAKLALEPLRANPSPSALMTLIPLAVLGCTLAAIGVAAARRLVALRIARPGVAAVLVAVVVGQSALPNASHAVETEATLTPEWAQLLTDYMRDQRRGRRALLKEGRRNRDVLPPVVVLALADARLRQGQGAGARRLFEEVAYGGAGSPWIEWAELGLGWSALLADDAAAAWRHFTRVAEGASATRPLGTLLAALVDTQGGWREEATQAFTTVVDDPDASPALRQAATLGLGYVAYWAAEPERAAAAFDQAARVGSGGSLWDDARYGAALARWVAGDDTQALVELRALARMVGHGSTRGPVPDGLIDLEQRALMRRALAGYRRGPLRAPEEQVTTLLDLDGPELARARLARRGEVVAPPGGIAERALARRRERTDAGNPASRKPPAPAPAAQGQAQTPRRSTRGSWSSALALALVTAGLAVPILRSRVRARRRPADYSRP